LAEVGADAPPAEPRSVGMAHFAFRMQDQDALEAAYAELKSSGTEIHYTVNHGVANSIYFFDPDGNELEVYADNPPEVVDAMPNPYTGTDKLPFAPHDRGIVEAMQGA
jgi:catechol 2,3-dioxygenase